MIKIHSLTCTPLPNAITINHVMKMIAFKIFALHHTMSMTNGKMKLIIYEARTPVTDNNIDEILRK
jgi:hypothetical protein